VSHSIHPSPQAATFIKDTKAQPKLNMVCSRASCLFSTRHFGNRASYGADEPAWSILARMVTNVSGNTASLVDVSSSTDHQR
jgi:hypothetical protein